MYVCVCVCEERGEGGKNHVYALLFGANELKEKRRSIEEKFGYHSVLSSMMDIKELMSQTQEIHRQREREMTVLSF